ncbi:ATP-binding cassette, subfamily B, MsbA [Fontibacillus panacisegetis]|uniref:ATP-binding cassette, subfamily B, MsbA n=1 Tax=Fontibacillus panacisegetis TaxID=670482 RepID=A0A1G7PZH3_9BACL|nr:ABC transporter ATP-binding protein [Fontibacillus panacisegetis]SDF91623.1 ATP-binding cassette, subfamily B, MsbA [Fontibacillus panacisegetis]
MRGIKSILFMVKNKKRLLIMILFLLGMESIVLIYNTQVQKYLIDDVFLKQMFDKLYILLLLLFSCIFLHAILNSLIPQVMQKYNYVIQKELSNGLLSVLYGYTIDELREKQTGNYVNYFTGDIQNAAIFVSDDIPKGIQSLFSVIIVSVVIAFLSPFLVVAVILFSLLIYFVSKKIEPSISESAGRAQEAKAKVISVIEEEISGTREIIAFNNKEWEKKRLISIFFDYFKHTTKEGDFQNKVIVRSEPIRWAVIWISLGYGGVLAMQGKISIGSFVVLYQFSLQLMNAVLSFTRFITSSWSQMQHIKRLEFIYDHNKKFNENTENLPSSFDSIKFHNVDFTYKGGKEPALKRINLTLPLGRKIAIVGESGSGKSTISKLLMRFYEPDSGDITVNGIVIQKFKNDDWFRHIAFVTQEAYLFPSTIRENLSLGSDYSNEELEYACNLAQIQEFINQFNQGFDTVIGEHGNTLSGGQKQRIILARSLLRTPEILVLDEATSALDLETERLVMRGIDLERKNKTTIVIAHRLSTIKNADVIFVMQHGDLVEYGAHNELLRKNGYYSKLVEKELLSSYTRSRLDTHM